MEGINHELPAPLESEFAEIAWGIPKSGEKHAPIWIARPKVTGKLELKIYNFHFIKEFEQKLYMTLFEFFYSVNYANVNYSVKYIFK